MTQALLGFLVCLIMVGLPCLAGFFLGRLFLFRLPEWATWLLGLVILGGISIAPFANKPFFNAYLMLWVYVMFLGLFFIMSLQVGAQWGRARQRYKRLILAWQARLSHDQSIATGSRLAVAYDLENLGKLHSWLGHHAEAVLLYDNAYVIFARELGTHPTIKKFLYAYSAALVQAQRKEEAEKIRKHAESIKSPDDEP